MENPDDLHDFPADHPARLLMIAQTRLSSCPAAANGTKSIVVAACGDYVVRLTAFVPGMITAVPPVWVELYDTCTERSLDAGVHRPLRSHLSRRGVSRRGKDPEFPRPPERYATMTL
jgi:hypothetical protein